jgi:hypothetical protein
MTKVSKEISDIRARLQAVHKAVISERRELRTKLEALDSPEARRALTAEHRTKRVIEERTLARKRVQDDCVATIARARATLERREALVGIEAVLRQSRFTVELPPRDWEKVLPHFRFGGPGYDERREQDRESQRLMVNELRALREEQTRLRWQGELKQYSPAELAGLAKGCLSSNDLALLSMVRRELQSRPHTDALVPAKVEITKALQAIEAPAGVRELTTMLDEIGGLAGELEGAYVEIVSGRLDDTDEKVAAIRAATKEHGPVDGPHEYVTARIRAREERKGQVAAAVTAEAKAIEAPPPPPTAA